MGKKVSPGSSSKNQMKVLKMMLITDLLYPLKPHHFKDNLQQTQMVKPPFQGDQFVDLQICYETLHLSRLDDIL